ncbi:MAG: hypothetical protein FWG09_07445, partial [Synergistaceae bacterium]|nr:hypothetical protein [Synergistaceae bacterium]
VKFTKYEAKNGVLEFRPESTAPAAPMEVAGEVPSETTGGGVAAKKPGGGAKFDQDDIMAKWVGDGMSAEITGSQVFIYIEGNDAGVTPFDYEWAEGKTEFGLSPSLMKYEGRQLAVMRFIQGEKLTLEIEGVYPDDPQDDQEDELIQISVSLTRATDADGVKIHPGFDVFDWGMGDQAEKEKIAGAIIEIWKKYGEQPDKKFLNAKALAKAIADYKGDWEDRLIFDIACELAGVDFGEYVDAFGY